MKMITIHPQFNHKSIQLFKKQISLLKKTNYTNITSYTYIYIYIVLTI